MAISDEEVRAATLAKVQQLRELHAGRIPRDTLMRGVEIHGIRVPIFNYQKGIFKPAITGRDGPALTVQTSVESPYDDEHDLDAGHITYKYRGTDPAHPDNRALRRARQLRTPIVYLVAVDPGIYDAIAPVYVVGEDPAQHQFTLVADSAIVPAEVPETISDQVRRGYVTSTHLHRLHQGKFRRMVLRAYRERCAICNLGHLQLLDAAHILPDRHEKGEPVVSNGLGLCKIHHSAYDAYIIGIDADTKVHVREDILEEKDGPMLKHGLQEMAGKRLVVVPARPDLRPNRDFLAERFERFKAA